MTEAIKMMLRREKTFINLASATKKFVIEMINNYEIPMTMLWEGWLELKLSVSVKIGRGGSYEPFKINVGTYITPFEILHEIFHYKKDLERRKLASERKAKPKFPSGREGWLEEVEATEFAISKYSEWTDRYRSSLLPLQLEFLDAVDKLVPVEFQEGE